MEKNKNHYLKVTENKDNSNSNEPEPTFLDKPKSDTPQNNPQLELKADRGALVLDTIRKNQGITCWDLEKITKIPHSTLFNFLRGMEFIGLVYSRKSYKDEYKIVRKFYASKNKTPYKTKEQEVDNNDS